MVQHVKVPAGGAKITVNRDFTLNVPDNPIIPYIEGDGTGLDITPVMIKVVDAAVAKAYGGKRRIHWMEIFAGEKSTKVYGPDVWLPDETLQLVKDYVVSIKGPLTTPVGGGIRSLNVALRQQLDLYVCLRPVRWFKGVPSPVKEPEKTDMVIFRENSEDIYAGIEWAAKTPEAQKLIAHNYYRPSDPKSADPKDLARFPDVKLVSIDDPLFGGWAKAQPKHFDDGGIFDQVYQPKSTN